MFHQQATTEALLAAGRVVLATVFLVAGIAKLFDREGTRVAVREFGAPQSTVGTLAIVVPLVEFAAAALLIPAATVVAGAAVALALLALFSAAIAMSLARGHRPDCHCFGQLHSSPAGPATLARNGALGVVAALVLAGSVAVPGTGLLDWTEGLDAPGRLIAALGITLATVVIAGLAAFVTVLRSYGSALARVERLEGALTEAGYELGDIDREPPLGLEPGTPAPAFTLTDAREGAGHEVVLSDLLEPSLPLLLVFTSPGCAPCQALMPDLAGWQGTHAERLTVAVLAHGNEAELRAEASPHGLRNVLCDSEGTLARAYGATGTPSAVLVSTDARIASPVAAGPGAIAELVAGVLDAVLPIGSRAPALDHLAALGRRSANLAGGRESLVVFWNPDCGFCRAMRDELLEWEAETEVSSPQLVVIAAADERRARAEGFAAPVLLDPDSSAAGAFGASGTPSAVAVDAQGLVASEVLVGAEAILRRARGPRLVQVEARA